MPEFDLKLISVKVLLSYKSETIESGQIKLNSKWQK